jgi:uncharacterized protein (DUF1330 family)
MKTVWSIGVAVLVGGIAGGVAVQSIHAQTKAPAWAVAEFEIVDAKIFQEFSAGNTKGVTDAGGRFVSRRGTTYSMAGEPPKTIALVAWDSFEQAEAYYKSDTWKNLAAARDKGAKFRAYLVEGTK